MPRKMRMQRLKNCVRVGETAVRLVKPLDFRKLLDLLAGSNAEPEEAS